MQPGFDAWLWRSMSCGAWNQLFQWRELSVLPLSDGELVHRQVGRENGRRCLRTGANIRRALKACKVWF